MTIIFKFIKKYNFTLTIGVFFSFLILIFNKIFHGIELSSDPIFFNILKATPDYIYNGRYADHYSLAGWPPLISYYFQCSDALGGGFLGYRFLFLITIVVGFSVYQKYFETDFSLKKYLIGLPILFFCIILFPQEDVLFSLLLLLIIYFYEKKQNYWALAALLLFGYAFVKIFTLLIHFLLVLNIFAREKKLKYQLLLPAVAFVAYVIFQWLTYKTFIFDIGDKSADFYNNSTSLAGILYYLTGKETHHFFSILFCIFVVWFCWFQFKNPSISFHKMLILFFLGFFITYFYYSPEYFIWLLFPVMMMAEKSPRGSLKYVFPLVSITAFSFNIVRSLYFSMAITTVKLEKIIPINFALYKDYWYFLMLATMFLTNFILWFWLKKHLLLLQNDKND
jgi:hypothetical protein